MDDNNMTGENSMDLDLNQEPIDPPVGPVTRFGSLLNQLETAHGRIEERILQLEAVTARARQRQRWRQARTNTETRQYPSSEMMVDLGGERGVVNGNNGPEMVERTIDRGCKRDSSHLVAKALDKDLELKKVDKEGGSFYDCNICLDVAREPILTCCGHLFCWACFYQVSYIDSTCKECPVCKGEVSDATMTPIYGNDNNSVDPILESGLKIPPRPKAHRVESVRQQQHGTRDLSHLPVAEALRRIRISIGAFGEQREIGRRVLDEPREAQSVEGSRRVRIQQVSRVLSESAASLTSLSTALNNAERLVEDLESVLNSRLLQSDERVDPTVGNGGESSGEINGQDSARATGPSSSSSSSFARRRSIMSRIYDTESHDLRESRRRRLN